MSGAATIAPRFSLANLKVQNPGLAAKYLWETNPMLSAPDGMWLNLGCGARSFDGFANIDIAPQDVNTTKWNLLDIWPAALEGQADGLFSEDCLEHFFHAEQTYILCNVNWVMKLGGTAKILMPDLPKSIASARDPVHPGDYLRKTYGVETASDLINYAMRFTGHRWTHSAASMARMAELCGFESTVTAVAESEVPKLRGRNLRDDLFSLSTDLKKTKDMRRILVSPTVGDGVEMVERVSDDAVLYMSTCIRPMVEYSSPRPLLSSQVGCINFRSANTGPADWNLKYLAFEDGEQLQWGFDETLKSQACMNIITHSQIRVALGGEREFSRMRFTPAFKPGEYFTLGPAEIFVAEEAVA
jgi:predicted SAM-dependent methyltransferase